MTGTAPSMSAAVIVDGNRDSGLLFGLSNVNIYTRDFRIN